MGQAFSKTRLKILRKMGAYGRIAKVLEKTDSNYAAGFVFTLLDDVLSAPKKPNFEQLRGLKKFLHQNQPLLFDAILDRFQNTATTALTTIINDQHMHPLTRFEAMGWANLYNHRQSDLLKNTCTSTPEIAQYWDQSPPSRITEGMGKWRGIGKSNYIAFDDTSASEFIREHFGNDAASAFHKLWHPALKSDFIRLYYLAKIGGVYVDADSEPQASSHRFCANDTCVTLSANSHLANCTTINGIMAAPAEHPFILGFLDHAQRNLHDKKIENIFWIAGPGALTLYLYQHGGDVDVLPHGLCTAQVFKQFDAAYKYTPQNWRVFEHQQHRDDAEILPRLLEQI
ncbi:hypothetical protein BFP76_05810 [Amylibacter kogurei]|uniref:Uncharacterized protein n=1 Tax=Paramylibacter kogurei TaxID=1889778 RepID=A0A2G5K5A2_9RHOB|nr:glycosyltransferase [Amylibacter kogurei]PIB24698.1 hypothetical protein BFP76_05810 [Amylibacter kogurei]